MAKLKFGDTSSCPAMHTSSDFYGMDPFDYLGKTDPYTKFHRWGNKSVYTFKGLEKIDDYGMGGLFACQGGHKTINFPDLTYIDICGLQYAFYNSRDVDVVTFPELSYVDMQGLTYAFANRMRGITTISFPKLTEMWNNAFERAFSSPIQNKLTDIYFPALNPSKLTESRGYFNNMLSGNSGVKVHFPASAQSILSSWSHVQSGFGGTNTQVLYDQ